MYCKLKGLMTEKNITQAQLAKLLGISVSTLNLKLNGKSDFTIQEGKKISRILNEEVEVIFR